MSSVWSPTQLQIFLIYNQFAIVQFAAFASHLSPGYLQEKTGSLPHSAIVKGGKALPTQSSLLKTEQTQLSASTQRLFASPSKHLGVLHPSMSMSDFTSHLTTDILHLKEGLTQLRDYPEQYSAANSTICCRKP